MSLIDSIFNPIPGPILVTFGQDITYIKASSNPTYNVTTGTVNGYTSSVTVRALITKAKPEEFEGFYQTSDLKVIIGNTELGDYYPTIRDTVQYTAAGATKTARIISVDSYRGEQAIMHTMLVRPQ